MKKPPVTKRQRKCLLCGATFLTTNPRGAYCEPCHHANCVICGSRFRRRFGARAIVQTCSPACRSKQAAKKRKRALLECRHCGTLFSPKSGHLGIKFCGRDCRYKSMRKDVSTTSANSRRLWKYKQWRKSVFQRDNYSCQKCGETSALHAHHIKPWSVYPHLAFEISNGMTLCSPCHKIAHGGLPMNTRGAKRIACEKCGKAITGRGKSKLCRRCSLKFSNASIKQRSSILRNASGRFSGGS